MINLLWTSGWDSTYRLLELTLIKNEVVQPYYVFDQDRRSAEIEFQTQGTIRASLQQLSPAASALVLPT